MKRLLFAAAAAASLALAAPVLIPGALAQPYAPTPPGPQVAPGQDIHAQLDALRERVRGGFEQGQLSKAETDRLYREIDRIGAVEASDRQSDGHLREHDRTDLQARIDTLSRSVHWRRAEAAPPPPMPEAAPPPPPAPMPVMAWTLDQREGWMQHRIDRSVEDHRLSGKETARGETELNAIRSEQARLVARDGGALSPEDHSYLVHRLDELNQTLRWAGRNPPPPWA